MKIKELGVSQCFDMPVQSCREVSARLSSGAPKIHRGFRLPSTIEGYDLATHERYEDRDWGKRWDPRGEA